jgi:hypothetical protein
LAMNTARRPPEGGRLWGVEEASGSGTSGFLGSIHATTHSLGYLVVRDRAR